MKNSTARVTVNGQEMIVSRQTSWDEFNAANDSMLDALNSDFPICSSVIMGDYEYKSDLETKSASFFSKVKRFLGL